MAKKSVNPLVFIEELKPEHYELANKLKPVSRLEENELAVWDRIAPFLAACKRLCGAYEDTFVEYCRVVAAIDKKHKFLLEEGETYDSHTRNGLQKKMRPEVGQLNELRRMLRSYVGDFGLTPSTEKQLNILQLDIFKEQEDNPFLALDREYRSTKTERTH